MLQIYEIVCSGLLKLTSDACAEQCALMLAVGTGRSHGGSAGGAVQPRRAQLGEWQRRHNTALLGPGHSDAAAHLQGMCIMCPALSESSHPLICFEQTTATIQAALMLVCLRISWAV